MTQEEKAKAYDEAIERAKEVYDAYRFSMDTSNFNPTDIEYIFPQLAESEDEKIRKWLYDYIERVGKTWGKQPFHYEQILDWIEKQKEQKPTERSEEVDDLKFKCKLLLMDINEIKAQVGRRMKMFEPFITASEHVKGRYDELLVLQDYLRVFPVNYRAEPPKED